MANYRFQIIKNCVQRLAILCSRGEQRLNSWLRQDFYIRISLTLCYILSTAHLTTSYTCSDLLNVRSSTSGIIYSNRNGTYSNYMTCKWTLSSNTNLELIFFRFDTELGYDYVYVYDGGSSSSPLIGQYHGNSLPPTITSSSNQLFVIFKTDYSIVNSGFAASYHGERLLSLSVSMSAKRAVTMTTIITRRTLAPKIYFTNRSA